MLLMNKMGLSWWMLVLLALLPTADSRELKEQPTRGGDHCSTILNWISGSRASSILKNNQNSEVSLAVHRNGETDACGITPSAISIDSLSKALQSFSVHNKCPQKFDKYHVESLLTEFVAQQFSSFMEDDDDDGLATCASTDRHKNQVISGFLGFCDPGPERLVPQPDTGRLINVPSSDSLPCRFYTREGVRISTLEQLAELVSTAAERRRNLADAMETCSEQEGGEEGTCSTDQPSTSPTHLDLYAVPAGRVFMFAPKYVGEIFELPHVLDKNGNQLSLEVLSLSPRVFDIYNFFDEVEAQQLIDKAISETSETHKLHRSTTGTVGASVINKRTSENAWDTHGKVANTIKRRCMTTLGFDEYYESHTDGLQILRYNLTTGYSQHMDYLSDVPREAYDYRSQGRGGNRFATILLYMSSLEEGWGGETLFSNANRPNAGDKTPPPPPQFSQAREMVQTLRSKGEIDMLTPGSWEEEMTGMCRTQLAVTPKKSRAVLFYSQFPNGTSDPMSEHGGCPVLQGTKWAANLWVWNAARREFDHAPLKFEEEIPKPDDGGYAAVSAVFFNSGGDKRFDRAQLFWHDQYFGELGAGETVRVNTYVTHVWNVKDRSGKTLHTWTVDHASTEDQHFTI